jgi:oxygen-independent coproporphyrinogen-3 oxidase
VHLYIHVPFCGRRCIYCDFAIAVRVNTPSQLFSQTILDEWRRWQHSPVWELGSTAIETIYFGGGTPSRLGPEAIQRIIEGVQEHRPLAPGAEITVEANPDDVIPGKVRSWAQAGVNRVSLGIQSFDPKVLQWMHRTHTARQARHAPKKVRDNGIENVSIDLIYGLPEALGRDWDADLDQAMALKLDHLSLYCLAAEPATPLARGVERGQVALPTSERVAQEYLAAHRAMLANGFEHYEVSNAAQPGRRAVHNSAYWTRAPFIGLGPSAHSGWASRRSWNIRNWEPYRKAMLREQPVEEEFEELTPDQTLLEDRYLGLRTSDGVPVELVPEPAATTWLEQGWATRSGDRIVLTVEGWLRLDALVRSIEEP